LDAPVTTATLPLSLLMVSSLSMVMIVERGCRPARGRRGRPRAAAKVH